MSFTGGGMGRRGGCHTKRAYPTFDDARSGINWMAENLGTYRYGLEVYKCPYKGCRQFHVRHKLPKDRKGKRWSTKSRR